MDENQSRVLTILLLGTAGLFLSALIAGAGLLRGNIETVINAAYYLLTWTALIIVLIIFAIAGRD